MKSFMIHLILRWQLQENSIEETDDKSVNVDVALGVMKHSTTDGIVLDGFSLIVVPTNDPYLVDLEDNEEIDLEKFEMMKLLPSERR